METNRQQAINEFYAHPKVKAWVAEGKSFTFFYSGCKPDGFYISNNDLSDMLMYTGNTLLEALNSTPVQIDEDVCFL
jgi:hypothetical protein